MNIRSTQDNISSSHSITSEPEITLALKGAAVTSPVPYVLIASTLALQALSTVQSAKNNKITFRRLAEDVCNLDHDVIRTFQELAEKTSEGELSKDGGYNIHLKTLVEILGEIRIFAKRRLELSWFKRIMTSKSDMGRIKEYRRRIGQALDMFELQSTITIRSVILQMAARLNDELQRLPNERRNTEDSVSDSSPSGRTSCSKQNTVPIPVPSSASESSNILGGAIRTESLVDDTSVENKYPSSSQENQNSAVGKEHPEENKPAVSVDDSSDPKSVTINLNISGGIFYNFTGSQNVVGHSNSRSLPGGNPYSDTNAGLSMDQGPMRQRTNPFSAH